MDGNLYTCNELLQIRCQIYTLVFVHIRLISVLILEHTSIFHQELPDVEIELRRVLDLYSFVYLSCHAFKLDI